MIFPVFTEKYLTKQFIKNLCFCNSHRITQEVFKASSHETYVETVGNAADTLHLGLEKWDVKALSDEYSRVTVRNVRKMHLGIVDVLIDITDEDFYGKVKGLWLHPWTGESGVKAHYQFIVCSVRHRNRKFPIAIRMLRIGADIAREIGNLLASCKRAWLVIRTVILDRGFYSADNIRELRDQDVFYLVFARKSSMFKNMLDGTKRSVMVEHILVLNKNKTKTKIATNIALVKNVHDYDWVFATNLDLNGREIVQRYRIRWNIETDFRVQDEVRIKSKSKRPEVRLFYFLVSSLLVFTWNATQKFVMSIKKFIIILTKNITNEVSTAD